MDVIQNNKLVDFFECAERMLTAVESFHRCGFVHRDVKPGAMLCLAHCGNVCGASQDRDTRRSKRMRSARIALRAAA